MAYTTILTAPRLADSITVERIQTPLNGATVLQPGDAAERALELLSAGKFDQAPVVRDGLPIGFVLTQDLAQTTGTIDDHIREILPHSLTAGDLKLEEVLPWLESQRFLFVLAGRAISGFVVPSDINRQAGRAYFYLAITSLELQAAEAVRAMARSTDVLRLLSAAEADDITRGLRARRRADVEADEVAEMYLRHLLRIVGQDERIREASGLLTPDEWDQTCDAIKNVRNRVAHATKPLLESPSGFGRLIEVSEAARRINDAILSVGRSKPPNSSFLEVPKAAQIVEAG